MGSEVIVVGAGVAGLQCARRLSKAGAEVLVIDRADKPGGRCATRRFDGQPADYGPLFLHGSHPDFLEALESIEGAQLVDGWPHRIAGGGKPCQPTAFAPNERRLALGEGVNLFPHWLSEGLEIRLGTRVRSIAASAGTLNVVSEEGETFQAREVVLALALEQSLPFVGMLPDSRERRGAIALLELFASLPCLTVIAGYPESRRAPVWDVLYPEDSGELLVVGNESSKRPRSGGLCLVFQATPRWSRERLELPRERWAPELLGCAGALLGAWAAEPQWTHPHRWRWGRLDAANELAAPLELEGPWGRLFVAGDLFAPGGGVQAAWLSGERAARRILARAGA
jgi:renalase